MGSTGLTCFLRHLGHAENTGQPPDIAQVRLYDVDGVHFDHPPKLGQVDILLTPCNRDVQRSCCFGGPLQLPVGAGLLVVHVPVVLEDSSHFDGPLRCVAAVGVGVHGNRISHRLAHGGDDLFGPSRPLILVVSDGFAQADLERAVSVRVHQPLEPFAFVFRCNLAAHAGAVDSDSLLFSSQHLTHALVLAFAAHVPQGRVDSGRRAAHIRPRKLEVTFDAPVHD